MSFNTKSSHNDKNSNAILPNSQIHYKTNMESFRNKTCLLQSSSREADGADFLRSGNHKRSFWRFVTGEGEVVVHESALNN